MFLLLLFTFNKFPRIPGALMAIFLSKDFACLNLFTHSSSFHCSSKTYKLIGLQIRVAAIQGPISILMQIKI